MSQALLGMVSGGNVIPTGGLQPQLMTNQHVRSVSFSEEAPCVKYIPGSAEQRGHQLPVGAERGAPLLPAPEAQGGLLPAHC